MKLEGRTALITGSGRNIGRATALRFAEEGANVVINARSNEVEANAVADEVRAIGRRALVAIADVSDRAQVQRMTDAAMAEFGRVDILISNAAVRPIKAFEQMTYEDWEFARGVVLDGAFYCARAVVPSMIVHGYGRIVFFTGGGAHRGVPERAHVSAAKMGLVGLARGLATELGPKGIRVNVISPGLIGTTRATGQELPSGRGNNPERTPLRRKGTAEEIANAALFLVSEDSSFITGQTVHVNGGGYYG
jgi:NAD(P)-dependent dehydrogenase (short-subunit alcohol dehydrogenase family)